MFRRSRLVVLPLVTAAALTIAACGSDYRYVSNATEKTFFRLPADVDVFRVQFQPSDRPARVIPGYGSPWQVVFDDAADPDPGHIDDAAPAEVVGRAMVIPVSFSDAEGLSVAAARSYLAGGVDPVQPPEPLQNEIELISYQDVAPRDGLVGSRVIYNRQIDPGTWTTFDQTSMIDVAARRLYLFEVKCSSACFKQAQGQISDIVDSWQVNP